VINPSQRPVPNNTQQSQQTNIRAPGGIRTHNLSGRAAEDLLLRPRGHWDRQSKMYIYLYFSFLLFLLRQPLRHSVNHFDSRLRNHVMRCFYILCYLSHSRPFVLMLTLQRKANFDDDTLPILTHSLIAQLLNLKFVTRKVLERVGLSTACANCRHYAH